MDRSTPSFEQFAAHRLLQDGEQITREWVDRLAERLHLDVYQVLPHAGIVDDIPTILGRAADFLLVPEVEKLTAEKVVAKEMMDIAVLRQSQGWKVQEVVGEFDELAQVLDGAALRWIDDYPGTPDAKSVGRTFGRLNRVPLLMGQVMVDALEEIRGDLIRQLSAAEEEERMRLSRELHDQVGQLLTALLLGLKSVARGPGAADQTARLEELEGLVDEIARATQQLALDLRPPALESLGLHLALESLVEEWSRRTGIEVGFHSAGMVHERFSQELESAVYRVTQEALNNVLKHARASHVSVIVELRHGALRLIVEDDGIGFDVEETLASPEKVRRLGVRGMRERVSRLGGVLNIESSPGSGTTLFVRFPDLAALSQVPGEPKIA